MVISEYRPQSSQVKLWTRRTEAKNDRRRVQTHPELYRIAVEPVFDLIQSKLHQSIHPNAISGLLTSPGMEYVLG